MTTLDDSLFYEDFVLVKFSWFINEGAVSAEEMFSALDESVYGAPDGEIRAIRGVNA